METKPSFSFGTPKKLFKNTNAGIGMDTGTPWDIHPDGNRFLMMKPLPSTDAEAEAPRPKIIIVTNWFEKLKKLVPAE